MLVPLVLILGGLALYWFVMRWLDASTQRAQEEVNRRQREQFSAMLEKKPRRPLNDSPAPLPPLRE